MLGKILGAFAGAKAAEHTNAIGGTGGAILGATAATLLRRASIPTLLAMTAGGYVLKRWMDKRDKRESFETPPRPSAA